MIARIFFGVPVYTMDEKRRTEEAVVSLNGRIEFVGDLKTAIELYPNAERIKYENGCILPGFVDAHIHLRELSMLYKDLDFSLVGSKSEIIELLGEKISKKKEGEWVSAGGCLPTLLDGLTAKEIDEVSPDNPVIVYSLNLGSALVNSRAMGLAGIDKNRSDPLRGRIEADAYNRPTGVLRDRAIDLVRKRIPDEKTKITEAALENGLEKLFSYGITTICDCSQDPLSYSIRSLLQFHKMKEIGSKALILFSELEAQDLGRLGMPSGFGNKYVRLGGVKLIIDGSLTTLTGYMSDPYRSSESYGILLIEEEELLSILRRSYTHYIWSSVQATGDRANTIALNCFENLSKQKGVPKLLRRIEYAQSIRDEDIERFAEIGVAAVGTPNRIPMERQRAIAHLGPNARHMFRYGGLLRAGAVLGIGSDAPRGSIDPFYSIYCAVERKDYEDGPERRFYPKECISMVEAVYAHTMGSATCCGIDEEVGSIDVGKSADMVHLSHDIFSISTEELRDIQPEHTIIDGEVAVGLEQ
jgi:predicted amidohydrolase YtcJ